MRTLIVLILLLLIAAPAVAGSVPPPDEFVVTQEMRDDTATSIVYDHMGEPIGLIERAQFNVGKWLVRFRTWLNDPAAGIGDH